jgi:integrase
MRRIHATLRSALNSATQRSLIPYNPALHVELERVRYAERPVWEAHHVAHFLDAIKDDPLMPMLHLITYRGLRRGEAIGLRWADVDLDDGHLRVRQQIVQLGHRTLVGPPKSDRSVRTVTLDVATVAVLRLQRRRQAAQRLTAGPDWEDTGLVFTRPDGRALDPGYVTKRFVALAHATGNLPGIRLHDLRHTSASLGLASGETLKEVSDRLGHSGIGITADIYSHVTTTMAKDSADKIARLISESR